MAVDRVYIMVYTVIQGDCNFIEKEQAFEDRFITRINLSKYDVP